MARPGSGGGGGEISSRISRDVVVKAVDALLQWLRNREIKPQLLEDDEFVYLQMSLQRFPSAGTKSGHVKPHFLPIPHPIYTDQPSSASLCVFFDDRSPSASAAAILDRARSLSLPVETAIGLSSLRTDYRPFEARRRLCNSYDLFFADRRIIPLLPRLIGKEFFRKKKTPLPIVFSRSTWPQQLRHCLNSAFLHPLSKGTSAAIKVGRASMTAEEIADNVMAVIEGAVEYVPKGFANIRSVHVKAARSVTLPIYQAVPQIGLKITIPSSAEEDLCGDEHEQDQIVDIKSDKGEDEKFSSQKKKRLKGRIHEEIMGYLEMNKNDTVDESDVDEDKNGEEEGREEDDKSTPTKKRKKKDKKVKKGKKHGNEENSDAMMQDNEHLQVKKCDASFALNNKMNENDIVDEGNADEDENGEEGGREEDDKSTATKNQKKKEGKTKSKKEKKVKKHKNEENFDTGMQENDLIEVKKGDASVALNKKMMKNNLKDVTKKLESEVKKNKKTKLRQT